MSQPEHLRSSAEHFRLVAGLRNNVRPIKGYSGDYDALLQEIGEARFVLLGEASHGTHEFYRERARITRQLITEKGFNAVAIEGDWPDSYRVNRYIRGGPQDKNAMEALTGFQRFPSWMWRNTDVRDFVEWLRYYNDHILDGDLKVGFYGLDLYSLYRSIEAVIGYLDKVDPEAARRAHYRYACFEHFGEDPQAYGYAANFGLSQTCQKEVVEQLMDLQKQACDYLCKESSETDDGFFSAQQNALVIQDAEAYYRTMFRGRNASWNLRDTHMADTLDNLSDYVTDKTGRPAKIVIWEHNSHVGDARATELGESGEVNVGELIRERYPDESFLVGFTTYKGTVTAAPNWDEPERCQRVQPALPGSYEWIFHEVGLANFLLILKNADPRLLSDLGEPMLERAIGVVYHPQTERISHYFYSHLAKQFDAVIHLDETQAVRPLDPSEQWDGSELPETFPSGF